MQTKIMKRLLEFAAYCPAGLDKSDASNLGTRGASIFVTNEADPENACMFLKLLLDCIEHWAALHLPQPSSPVPTAVSFRFAYEELRREGIAFPSDTTRLEPVAFKPTDRDQRSKTMIISQNRRRDSLIQGVPGANPEAVAPVHPPISSGSGNQIDKA